jgi:hypothetical protein
MSGLAATRAVVRYDCERIPPPMGKYTLHRRLRLLAFPTLSGSARAPRMNERSPGSRTKSLRTCQGLRPRRTERRLAMSSPPISPSAVTKASAPGTITFRGSMAGLCVPLPTLRPEPRGSMTHGSGPMRIANPSSQRTFTTYSSQVSRRTVTVILIHHRRVDAGKRLRTYCAIGDGENCMCPRHDVMRSDVVEVDAGRKRRDRRTPPRPLQP